MAPDRLQLLFVSVVRMRKINLRPDILRREMDIIGWLPLEVVGEILKYLTSEELVNCLHVSPKWRQVKTIAHSRL